MSEALMDAIVAGAELYHGASTAWVAQRFTHHPSVQPKQVRPAAWSKEELEFVRQWIGVLPNAVIAEHLGRSEDAIKIIQIRKGIHAPSKRPGYLTGNQAGMVLGMDIHSIVRLSESGILPMERVPGMRGILNIHVTQLYMWAINPRHWMYFKLHRMRDRHLARLVELAQSRWGDQWLTIGQAAKMLGVTVGGVNQAIRRGQVPDVVDWGNWWIKRSVVEQLKIRPGKGSSHGTTFTQRADEFLRRAYDLGLTCTEIGRMMKRSPRAVNYRMRCLGLYRNPQWKHKKDTL